MKIEILLFFLNTLFSGDNIFEDKFVSLDHQPAQIGCVYPMTIVVSILLHAEFEYNGNREDAPRFSVIGVTE